MKKYISILAATAFASVACAETYYWNFSAGWWANWTANFTKSDGLKGNPSPTDDIIFSQYEYYSSTAKNQASIVVDEKVVNNLTFMNIYTDDAANPGKYLAGWTSIYSGNKTDNGNREYVTFKVNGNLTFINSANSGSAQINSNEGANGAPMKLIIGSADGGPNNGNIYIGGQQGQNANAKLILGSMSDRGALNSVVVYNNVYFNGGQFEVNATRFDSVSSVENPDVDIKGVFYFNTSGSLGLSRRTTSGDTYFKVGGLESLMSGNKVSNSAGSTSTGKTFLVFNNEAGFTYNYSGWMREYNANRTLNFIMAGAGEQTVYETTESKDIAEFMRGEILVRNGTFQMGTAAGEVARVSIEGGRFSAHGKDTNVGTLKVKKLDWSSGSLLVNFDAAGKTCDLISISGDFGKLGANGFQYLIELDFASLNAGDSFKIVEWKGSTDFLATDFVANSQDGLSATFEIIDNSLWAKIVQVPEASTAAAILGAFALLFAISRRRR